MVHVSLWLPKNRMLELSTSGSVGGAVGNHCFYPAPNRAYRPARIGCQTRIVVCLVAEVASRIRPGG